MKIERFRPSSLIETWVPDIVRYGFLSSTTWVVTKTGVFDIYCVGGGGGAGGQAVPGQTGSGGGSGYLSITRVLLTAGQSLTITIGSGGTGAGGAGATGDGGITSVLRGTEILATASGGRGRPRPFSNNAVGGDGGSGGGSAADGGGGGGGRGGYDGSDGQHGSNTTGFGGAGQTNTHWGRGTNSLVPPGGTAGYVGSAIFWPGIFGFGSGNQGISNTDPTCRGGGGGGATWAQTGRSGTAGLVVIVG